MSSLSSTPGCSPSTGNVCSAALLQDWWSATDYQPPFKKFCGQSFRMTCIRQRRWLKMFLEEKYKAKSAMLLRWFLLTEEGYYHHSQQWGDKMLFSSFHGYTTKHSREIYHRKPPFGCSPALMWRGWIAKEMTLMSSAYLQPDKEHGPEEGLRWKHGYCSEEQKSLRNANRHILFSSMTSPKLHIFRNCDCHSCCFYFRMFCFFLSASRFIKLVVFFI